jgi:hypothetical protein
LTLAREEPAQVWDLEIGALPGEFGTSVEGDFVAGAFHPTEPKLYAEVGADLIGFFTLDPDELVEIARSRLSRDPILPIFWPSSSQGRDLRGSLAC